jgi:hypothetical protein
MRLSRELHIGRRTLARSPPLVYADKLRRRCSHGAAECWLQVFEERLEGSSDLPELTRITAAAIALFVSQLVLTGQVTHWAGGSYVASLGLVTEKTLLWSLLALPARSDPRVTPENLRVSRKEDVWGREFKWDDQGKVLSVQRWYAIRSPPAIQSG